jgi:serine/threonine protein kinase
MRCPQCRRDLPTDANFCQQCGTSLDNDATRRLETPKTPSRTTSFESIDDARFVPGTILAERYRIVGLLGRGGMGEVYRADDLKLSQPVALKFLPSNYLKDGAALARFHREVRVARQVSHKNVCRVYDIGELNGHHYLSMEYIKGEELASLLRRIGRLPPDKALQIARQICAGLAAAHDAGVLHRDLKPANVMIDGDGNARITDFGLAGLEDEFREDEMGAGTPAYMAPEQLDSQPVSVRTDIYSLGLVLYEVFTGKRAFEAANLTDLIKLRRSDTTPTTPTSIVKDLDPLIERVIDRCLEKDPTKRPESALQVAAALPGGDPIAAALAAGETPSPEMVAAAPKEGALKPRIAIICLLASILFLGFQILFSGQSRVQRSVPLNKPPEVLAERAREIIESLGYSTVAVDSSHAFGGDSSFEDHLRETSFKNWQLIKTGQPLVMHFWYRQSPRYMVPQIGEVLVSENDPPMDVAGMTSVALDTRGRLVRFDHQPPQVDVETNNTQTTNWAPLFLAAGINYESFKTTQSKWLPPSYADERMAWEGPHVDHPEISVRIEAAAFRKKPVHFSVIFPWDKPLRQEEWSTTTGRRVAAIILTSVFFGVLLAAALLGRRNLKLGRSDRNGAFKLALFVFLIAEVGALIAVRHVPDLFSELYIAYNVTRDSLFSAALIWLLYVSLEPEVRRRWPRLIISWTRLMSGSFRDPMVGRDLLVGAMLGLCHSGLISLGGLIPHWLGYDSPPALTSDATAFMGLRFVLAAFLNGHIILSVFVGFAFLFVLLLLFIIFRREWLASIAMFILVAIVEVAAFAVSGPKFYWLTSILIAFLVTIVVARFGLLATISFQLAFFVTMALPLTTDVSSWFVPVTYFAVLVSMGLAVYGFHTSLGGQQIFSGKLLKE